MQWSTHLTSKGTRMFSIAIFGLVSRGQRQYQIWPCRSRWCAVLVPLLAQVTNEFSGPYASLALTWTRLSQAVSWDISSPYKASKGGKLITPNLSTEWNASSLHNWDIDQKHQSSRQVEEEELFQATLHLHAPICPQLHWIVEHHVHTFSNRCYWKHPFSLTIVPCHNWVRKVTLHQDKYVLQHQ